MSSRVGSAALALTATVLIALSITPIGHALGARGLSSWWSGNPTIEDHESHLFKIHVGLVKSAFCYVDRHGGGVRECTAEDEQLARDEGRPMTCGCSGVPLGTGFRITKYVTFGFALLLVFGLVATALAKKRRAAAGKVVLLAAAITSILTIVVLVMGPSIAGVEATVPLSIAGLGVYFVGVALSLVTGLLALRPEKPAVPGWAPTLPSRPSQNPMMHAPHGAAPIAPAQPFDVHALLQEDALRPAALGPEPQLGRPNPMQLPPSPGGALPGPSGPLAPPPGPQPLFSSAPQLRPLYEVQGNAPTQMAPPQPPLPPRGPTPLPMAAVNALTGQPAPIPPSAPFVPPLPPTIPAAAPPAPTPPPPSPSPRPKTLPPPLRNKPASVAPPIPIPPRAFPTAPPPPNAPKPTMVSSAAVPPPRDVPPPSPPKLPPPKAPIQKPGATLAGPLAGYALPRAATDPAEHAATEDFEKATIDRDFDGMATAAREKHSATSLTSPVGAPSIATDRTDPAAFAVESTLAATPFESEVETHVTPPTDDDSVETSAAPKVDPLEATYEATQTSTAIVPDAPTRMERPSARVSAAVLTSAPRTTPPPMAAERPARATGAQPQVPLSTAPESLPPPAEDEPATAIGPTPACPQCEAPMGWVEEHLRFYCKSCRMYF